MRILFEPNRYRACEVVRVKEGVKSYKFKNETGVTKVITLKYGSTEKDYQMCYVSNEPITQDEYDRWSLTAKEKNQTMPNGNHVILKQTHRKEMDDFVYTNEDIDKIVELNQKKKKVFNIAQRKQYLQHALLAEEDEDKKR